jgi:precorrin-6Y C5,15-methyltransferase (decarboxylating)
MNEIIVFGGTTEGRQLAERLAAAAIHVVYCVATEYGKQPVTQSDYIKVHEGRMDASQMACLYDAISPCVVVDATHPFAEIVKKEIAESLKKYPAIQFFRLLRDEDFIDYSGCKFFENTESCAKALVNTTGTVFLTTGSKELPLFCHDDSLRERIFARVIPSEESIKLCTANGLSGKQIIAMQGPFSKAINYAMLKETGADIIVMKDSGKASGEAERIEAARAAGAQIYIIKRPEEKVEGLSFDQVLEKISEAFGVDLVEHFVMKSSEPTKIEVTLAGFGMGFGSITLEVEEAIKTADFIFGAPRMIASIEANGKKYPYYLAKDIIPVIKDEIENGTGGRKKAVVLFSGDTSFYSGAKNLLSALEDIEGCATKVLPGISSVSALAAKCGQSIQDADIISSHGVEADVWQARFLDLANHSKKFFMLTSGSKDVRTIGQMLLSLEEKYNRKYDIKAGFNLYADEKLLKLSAKQCTAVNEDGLCVLLIQNDKADGKRLVPGLSDETFNRNKTPMSKSEVRALSICKLSVTRDAIVYDIGSGSGSVAVEMALLDSSVQVYAIEFKPDATSLIKENIEKFNLKNVHLIEGVAPEALSGLPAPTHVFVGGSGGRLSELITVLKGYETPIKIVINAVTLETIAEVNTVLKANGIDDADIVQLNVSKAKRAGDYSVMQGQNPVYIVTFNI